MLDYWIAQLKARGIYVYLDLLDFRTFRQAEGVPQGEELGRGAKPYALFDARIIELQEQYARSLLFEHRNPYTGLTYAEDPAVCMVELCDENGLFHEMKRLDRMGGEYRGQLVERWNAWLAARYVTREALAKAWTQKGVCCLSGHEDPARGTVGLPGASAGCDEAAPRLADRSVFFAAVHRGYFRQMLGLLRSNGLQCPVSAVTDPRTLADLWAGAQELDFIATNHYFDHPYFKPESDWQLPAFFSGDNPCRASTQDAFAPRVAAAKVVGKPLVIREWGVCWPNEMRGPGMLQATAYACLQDVDAMILFTLDTRPGAWKLGYFDVRRDPTRWGLASVCGRLFLERQVRPGRQTVDVPFAAHEVFSAQMLRLPTPLHGLAHTRSAATVFTEGDSAPRDVPSPGFATLVSDTDEVFLDRQAGILRLETPLCRAVAGELDNAGWVACGPVSFNLNATAATCVWQSLDGLPAGESRRWVLKYVTIARNTDQRVRVHLKTQRRRIFALEAQGSAPITTGGEASGRPVSVRVNNASLIDAYMRNGCFELYRRDDRMYLYCDTPGARVELAAAAGRPLTAFYDNEGHSLGYTEREPWVVWPDNTALLEVVLDPPAPGD